MGCGASSASPPASGAPTVTSTTDTKTAAVIVATSDEDRFAGIDPRVKDVFILIDKNGDGQLSKTEILIALRKQEAVRTMLGLAAVKFAEGAEKDAFEQAFEKMDAEYALSASTHCTYNLYS